MRRVVVESPVEQDVTLHSETVVVERRRPQANIGQDVLTEVTVEMSETNEVPVVSKSVHLVEEVLLRKEVTARTEKIRDTVKRDITLKMALDGETAKKIAAAIKEAKLKKVQAAIQGDQVRVSSPSRDDLQEAMALLRQQPAAPRKS